MFTLLLLNLQLLVQLLVIYQLWQSIWNIQTKLDTTAADTYRYLNFHTMDSYTKKAKEVVIAQTTVHKDKRLAVVKLT